MTATKPQNPARATLSAGIPEINSLLLWRVRFCVGDPVAVVDVPTAGGTRSTLILRDIEMGRARQSARVDRVACPADFAPADGLSGDRETATAQAAAECLRRAGVTQVTADRTLPLIYAEVLRHAGIEVLCEPDLWLADRRRKTPDEIEHIRASQQATEAVMEQACRMIATAEARRDGVLVRDGAPLTSERVRTAIDHWLLDLGFSNPPPIVAGGPAGGDCHNLGSGELRTGEPVIVDIFPRSRRTRYCGDCTRTVVHGDVPDEVRRMHAAVCAAKAAAAAAIAPGVTGEAVHAATTRMMLDRGYSVGLPDRNAPASRCALTHGTGHGVGLDVHEPPLLDVRGPELLVGDVVTTEPGLYRPDLGGVRVENIVVVTDAGCESLNKLPEGLDWK